MTAAAAGAWGDAYRWGGRTIMARNSIEALIALVRITIWLCQLGARWWKRQDAALLLRNLRIQTGRRLISIGMLIAFYVTLVVLQAILFAIFLPTLPAIALGVFVGTLIGKHGAGKITRFILTRL